MNFRSFFPLLALCLTGSLASEGQSYTGNRDTIKKVIPQQVYGRPKAKKKVDSAAVLKRMKEIQRMEAQDSSISKEQLQNVPPTSSEQSSDNSNSSKVLILKRDENGVRVEQEVYVVPPNQSNEGNTDNEEFSAVLMASPPPPLIENNTDTWSLLRCVNYAREHNLQVKSAELNERLARLQFQQNRSSRLPNLNADATLGDSYGRSIDPTTNQFVTKGFIYNSLGLNSQVLVFGWFQRKYQSEQDRLDILSTQEANQQLKDDIALNVATGFLRVLMAREQIKIAEAQLKLDAEQYDQTLRFAEAGKIPELNVSQMQSQMANDSSTYIGTVSEEQLALLQLRALLNLDFERDFDIQAPNINAIETAEGYSVMLPEEIVNHAIQHQHRMKFNHLKLAASKKALRVAKSAQYPQLAIFAGLGTNFSSNVKTISGQTFEGNETIGFVNVANIDYPITVPRYSYQTRMMPIFDQYNQNLRANAGLSLTVPILNGRSARINVERARIGMRNQEISYEVDQQKLKQDIYTAHQQVVAARQKYLAAQKAEDAARRALEFAKKRYAIGMINTFEYTSVQNSHNQASASKLSTKYDLIFKLKVLDYYMGNQIKL